MKNKLSSRNVSYAGGDPEPEDFSNRSKSTSTRRSRLGVIVEVSSKGKAAKRLTGRKSVPIEHHSVDHRRKDKIKTR